MTDAREVIARALRGPLSKPDANGYPAATVDCTLLANAALSALAEAGYCVMPKEPTEAMIVACRKVVADWKAGLTEAATDADIYRAMIAAAEKP